MGFLDGTVVKHMPPNVRHARDEGSIPESGRFPGGGMWPPTPVFLPGESHGQRSLAGYREDQREVAKRTPLSTHTHVLSTFSRVEWGRLQPRLHMDFFLIPGRTQRQGQMHQDLWNRGRGSILKGTAPAARASALSPRSPRAVSKSLSRLTLAFYRVPLIHGAISVHPVKKYIYISGKCYLRLHSEQNSSTGAWRFE